MRTSKPNLEYLVFALRLCILAAGRVEMAGSRKAKASAVGSDVVAAYGPCVRVGARSPKVDPPLDAPPAGSAIATWRHVTVMRGRVWGRATVGGDT